MDLKQIKDLLKTYTKHTPVGAKRDRSQSLSIANNLSKVMLRPNL